MDITELDLLLRAVASPSRLRLLSLLFHAPPPDPELGPTPPGIRPGDLALQLGLSRSAASHHLKILLRLRLVRYWKKGPFKFYAPARPPASSLRSKLMDQLKEDLPELEVPEKLPPRPGRGTRPRKHGNLAKSPFGEVWMALTAFSNFRRLLMLKRLLTGKGASVAELVRICDLDRKTVKYHLDKLRRRGVVDDEAGGVILSGKPASPLQSRILMLVSAPVGGWAARPGY